VSLFYWWGRRKLPPSGSSEQRVREKYHSFRDLLSLNSECLELMASLQEDLQYVLPRRDVVGDRVASVFDKTSRTIAALEKLTGTRLAQLLDALADQRSEVERYVAAQQELITPRLASWLHEIDAGTVAETGGKASVLGEVKNRIGLPVPDGYVLTTEAYRQFCGIPLWKKIRDVIRGAEMTDPESLHALSLSLTELVMAQPVPRAVEVAITERALTLPAGDLGFAVRSSSVGEGGEKTFAGQFVSLINVPRDQVVDAYKKVVAGRFSETALSYRLSNGLLEAETPMAVLFLPVIHAKASGVMYTRDPANPKSKELWITATRGLGLEIASGRMPADLFVVSRDRSCDILQSHIVRKSEVLVPNPGGGLAQRELPREEADAPSLTVSEIRSLVDWGIQIEDHFKAPQDVEWALGDDGRLWILQARPLALADAPGGRVKARARAEPLAAGGRTIYPGRASGPAYIANDRQALRRAPEGAIVFVPKASPEIVQVLSRIAGLVAQWGNVAGHAAALLREFKVPSVFLMPDCLEKARNGDAVSLDAVQARLYPGVLWQTEKPAPAGAEGMQRRLGDPVNRRVVALNLLDPAADNFRPSGCRSTHDVLRYCHEKAVEAMFAVNDFALDSRDHRSRKLTTPLPLNVYVLDLGGGLSGREVEGPAVSPDEIASRPFQALWKGLTHPAVSWRREMPAGLTDLASVVAGSLYSGGNSTRGLGERSYLLVAEEYMNFNARLAYHFSLVDACLSDTPSNNYVSFRFAGGGATRYRRNLRACFLDACLKHYGFSVDRRGDLLNAWYKKGPPGETGDKLDILGRVMACSSQLDMYMTSRDVMTWYVDQFVAGNYSFSHPRNKETAAEEAT